MRLQQAPVLNLQAGDTRKFASIIRHQCSSISDCSGCNPKVVRADIFATLFKFGTDSCILLGDIFGEFNHFMDFEKFLNLSQDAHGLAAFFRTDQEFGIDRQRNRNIKGVVLPPTLTNLRMTTGIHDAGVRIEKPHRSGFGGGDGRLRAVFGLAKIIHIRECSGGALEPTWRVSHFIAVARFPRMASPDNPNARPFLKRHVCSPRLLLGDADSGIRKFDSQSCHARRLPVFVTTRKESQFVMSNFIRAENGV